MNNESGSQPLRSAGLVEKNTHVNLELHCSWISAMIDLCPECFGILKVRHLTMPGFRGLSVKTLQGKLHWKNLEKMSLVHDKEKGVMIRRRGYFNMHKGRKQHVMFKKLLAACQWGYGGKPDHGSDYIDLVHMNSCLRCAGQPLEDFKLADHDHNCNLKRSF